MTIQDHTVSSLSLSSILHNEGRLRTMAANVIYDYSTYLSLFIVMQPQMLEVKGFACWLVRLDLPRPHPY